MVLTTDCIPFGQLFAQHSQIMRTTRLHGCQDELLLFFGDNGGSGALPLETGTSHSFFNNNCKTLVQPVFYSFILRLLLLLQLLMLLLVVVVLVVVLLLPLLLPFLVYFYCFFYNYYSYFYDYCYYSQSSTLLYSA